MIGSFRAVSSADPATKAQLLSEGISHALNCTGFGLTVAIVAIVFYGLFQHMIQRSESEMIETSMTMLNLVASNRDKLRE
jgi:biopolymer transport protein ExbB/TolQ